MDRLEVSFGVDKMRVTSMISFPFNDNEADEDIFEKSLKCRKLLLQAGADPTLGLVYYPGQCRSVLRQALGDSAGGRRIIVSPHDS